MTKETEQLVGNNVPVEEKSSLSQEILNIIQETGSGTGLEGLLSFESKLSEKERRLTPSEITLIMNKIKKDIQNPEFLSFESGSYNNKDFGFEGVGTDVVPTLSPNGDCIIPVNFWYDGQRRTILLILEVSPNGEETIYRLPEGDNHYKMKINEVEFTYQLVEEGKCFKMKLKEN